MKILFISAASNIHTKRWVNSLDVKGHDVMLLSLKNHNAKKNDYNKSVTIKYLPIAGKIGYYLNFNFLKQIKKKFNPDIINVHYASGYGTLSRISNIHPIVLSVWGSDVYDFPFFNKWNFKIIKKNLEYADFIASTSESMDDFVKKNIYENSKTYVTPFGVDCNKFRKIALPRNNDEFNVGVVKTLSEKYGIKYIIKAFSIFLNNIKIDRSKIKLLIYGKGPDEEKLKSYVIQLGIQSNVKFKGFVENEKLPGIINSFDIFCLGSILDSESFGVAAVEAMACEVPVIVPDVSGFKEVTENGKYGYVVKRKNPEEMAVALEKLFKDKTLRQKLGESGRLRVLEKYNWEENVNEMEKLYYTANKIKRN